MRWIAMLTLSLAAQAVLPPQAQRAAEDAAASAAAAARLGVPAPESITATAPYRYEARARGCSVEVRIIMHPPPANAPPGAVNFAAIAGAPRC